MSNVSRSSTSLSPSFYKSASPIPFIFKVKKMDKVDGSDADKSEWIKLKLLMDADNSASYFKYSQKFVIFKDGCPEEWIKCFLVDGLL
jgi:hypothetical protein